MENIVQCGEKRSAIDRAPLATLIHSALASCEKTLDWRPKWCGTVYNDIFVHFMPLLHHSGYFPNEITISMPPRGAQSSRDRNNEYRWGATKIMKDADDWKWLTSQTIQIAMRLLILTNDLKEFKHWGPDRKDGEFIKHNLRDVSGRDVLLLALYMKPPNIKYALTNHLSYSKCKCRRNCSKRCKNVWQVVNSVILQYVTMGGEVVTFQGMYGYDDLLRDVMDITYPVIENLITMPAPLLRIIAGYWIG